MRLNSLIPAAVIRYLQHDGLPARDEVVQQVNRTVEEGWKQSAHAPGVNEPVSARQL